MKNALLTTILLSVYFISTYAQDGVIKGKVESHQLPVEMATIKLMTTDSTIIKQKTTDKEGNFLIDKLNAGTYLISVSAVGNNVYFSQPIAIDKSHPAYNFNIINLVESAKLNDVVVTSKKQFIEQQIDKTVLNVDASPTNTGLSALEVLQKSPGVTVDKDGNISLKGKQGVLVLIDGKPSYLSGQDLANLLKNMPSTMLDQIEIMTNPPAKYDAAGNAGIINIKTKKSKTKGFNTSVTLGASQGKFPKANESINLNYRTGKVNLFANYSYNYYKSYQSLDLSRKFRDSTSGDIESIFNQHSDMYPNYQSHNIKAGMDYYVTKKTTVGFVANANFNPGTFNMNDLTNIYNADNNLENQTSTSNSSNDKWRNTGINLNLDSKFDTTGREITANLDYMHYFSLSNQLFNNYFFDAKGNVSSPEETLRGYTPSTINIYSAKVDYTLPLKKSLKLDAGLKTSYVKTDNTANYDNFINSNWVEDSGRTNHFIYTENINAAYVNMSKQINKKWSAQAGLRVENTNAKGNQQTTGEAFTRNYTQLFPTAYVSYNLNDKNQFQLNYGRRIQRPDYSDLNPFYYFIDKYTYQVGNPYLRPQISNNIELNHSYKGMFTTSLSYTAVNDIIQQQLEQIDSTHTTFVKQSNLAQQRSVSLSFSANMPVTKWYRLNLYMQGSYNKYKGFINDGILDVSGPSFNANMSNEFQLPKGWSMELSGYFNSKAIYGTVEGLPQGSADFAVSKNILKDKGTVKLNFRDFMGLQGWRGVSRYQNIDVTIKNHWDSRVVGFSFTYRFNKGKISEQHKNANGSEEEQSRVKSGRG